MVPERPAPPRQDAGAAAPATPAVPPLKIPFWIECAIRLGKRFVRVAAAAYPPASTELKPRHICGHHLGQPKKHPDKDECCVTCCPECGCEHPAHVDEYWFWLIDAKVLFSRETARLHGRLRRRAEFLLRPDHAGFHPVA